MIKWVMLGYSVRDLLARLFAWMAVIMENTSHRLAPRKLVRQDLPDVGRDSSPRDALTEEKKHMTLDKTIRKELSEQLCKILEVTKLSAMQIGLERFIVKGDNAFIDLFHGLALEENEVKIGNGRFETAIMTDRGEGDKTRNEDACACACATVKGQTVYSLAVADGVSTSPYGDFASSCSAGYSVLQVLLMLASLEDDLSNENEYGLTKDSPSIRLAQRAIESLFSTQNRQTKTGNSERIYAHVQQAKKCMIGEQLSRVCSKAKEVVDSFVENGSLEPSVRERNILRSLSSLLSRGEAFHTTAIVCLLQNAAFTCGCLGNGAVIKVSKAGNAELLWFPDPEQELSSFLGPESKGTPEYVVGELGAGEMLVLASDGIVSFPAFTQAWNLAVNKSENTSHEDNLNEQLSAVVQNLKEYQAAELEDYLRDNLTLCFIKVT